MNWGTDGRELGDGADLSPVPAGPARDAAIAAAADLCLKPWRHAVLPVGSQQDNNGEIHVRLEAHCSQGERRPDHDLELEIYRSGRDLHVMVSWCQPPERPMLWHGRHPVWMDGSQGQRCERPLDGAPLEALARRLRALLLD